MRRKVIRSITILTLIGVAGSLVVWAFGASSNLPQSQHGQEKRKTLQEIGQERDFEMEAPHSENGVEYRDLRLLAQHSHVIIIGRIVNENSEITGEYDISTYYLLNVKRVVKDEGANLIPILHLIGEQEVPGSLATPLRILRQGGVVSVNGHRVAQTLRGSEALKVGQDYLFFLHWSRDFKSYRLAGGMSGAILIKPDLTVKVLGSRKALLRYNGTGLETLIQELVGAQ